MKNKKVKKVRRVMLAVGGADEDRIKKAAASDADMVFCDLEDAVAPNQKANARAIVARAISTLDWHTKIKAVRINGLETPHWQDDLNLLLEKSGEAIDSIIIPKVGSVKDVRAVEKKLSALERKFKIQTPLALECLIETLEGIENASAIARASTRIESLIFGSGDFAASMGMKPHLPHMGDLFYYPRFRLVAAARGAHLDAIDAPFFDFRNDEAFALACSHAAALGFGGKMIIHPAQIEVGLKTFTPQKEEVAHAQRVLAAYEKAHAEGIGVIAVEGEMIDVATARLYQNLVDRAALCEA